MMSMGQAVPETKAERSAQEQRATKREGRRYW